MAQAAFTVRRQEVTRRLGRTHLLQQPYAAFPRPLLEVQDYPHLLIRRWPAAAPYDTPRRPCPMLLASAYSSTRPSRSDTKLLSSIKIPQWSPRHPHREHRCLCD